MRAYFFGNMYLSQIQQGIQAGHVIGEMFTKYGPFYSVSASQIDPMHGDISEEFANLAYWAEHEKTMILLNGGYGENLHDLITFFDQNDNPYPFAYFKESEAALDNALTSVGIILPPKIYDGGKEMRNVKRMRRDDPARLAFEEDRVLTIDETEVQYTEFEVELMERLSTMRLA